MFVSRYSRVLQVAIRWSMSGVRDQWFARLALSSPLWTRTHTKERKKEAAVGGQINPLNFSLFFARHELLSAEEVTRLL